MMRHALSFRKRHFGRGDLDLAIDLHRVAIDDLAIEAQRERDAERALPRRGRPHDGDDGSLWRRVWRHVLCNSKRKMMTSQMMASSASAPASCLREKLITVSKQKLSQLLRARSDQRAPSALEDRHERLPR